MDVMEKAFNVGYALLPRIRRQRIDGPLLVGHRGVCGHPRIKENTLEAFDLAVGLGGGIELDLRLTKDGVPVVSHDGDLRRIFSVDGVIEELDLVELKKRAPDLPTLDEVFDRYGGRCPHYFLESKIYHPEVEAMTLISLIRALVDQHGLAQRVSLISLDSRPLDHAREVFPELPKVYVFGVDPSQAIRYALSNKDTGIAGWYFSYPRRIRQFLAERNLHEGVGHIDYKTTMTAYSNKGFRYVFTNRIDRIATPTTRC